LSSGPASRPAPGDGAAPPDLRAYERHALTHAGDAGRGRALFFDDPRTACATCHRVGDRGGAVGPDLSHVGGKFDRPHLIESVLEPSRQIVEGYRTTILDTVDGATEAGVVKAWTEREVTLADAKGQRAIPLARGEAAAGRARCR
jgi:putative heme-binding domain-containing protein